MRWDQVILSVVLPRVRLILIRRICLLDCRCVVVFGCKMGCVHPLKAFWRSRARDAITFDINKSATRISFVLPCGRCIGCRMEKARQWGLRCLHEKKMWAHNQYVTLTYNDENLPPGGSVCLRDVQLFMKRLRKAKGSSKSNPLRFFLGAEYGDNNYRPHYHALLFNCEFADKVYWSDNKRGEPLYTSKELTELWNMGHCSVGEVTFDSAVYCAKYALKKINITEHSSDQARAEWERRYIVYDDCGEVFERSAEFAVMSRRPGIGSGYYERFGAEVRAHDSVIVNGRAVRPPRFYDVRSEDVDPDGFAIVKASRKREAVKESVKADNTPERLRVKETLLIAAEKKKERAL
ncbi:replication initiator protein [Blackfly microvirus SF02]|uniref:Replication initiator protein n=1 Tax=Blackfly microvirus SF02 TaxID=2576452 RepID=A0A4P8PK47_9VIRU|nr:replication initiator protein [Blackfly microvirus SF02]